MNAAERKKKEQADKVAKVKDQDLLAKVAARRREQEENDVPNSNYEIFGTRSASAASHSGDMKKKKFLKKQLPDPVAQDKERLSNILAARRAACDETENPEFDDESIGGMSLGAKGRQERSKSRQMAEAAAKDRERLAQILAVRKEGIDGGLGMLEVPVKGTKNVKKQSPTKESDFDRIMAQRRATVEEETMDMTLGMKGRQEREKSRKATQAAAKDRERLSQILASRKEEAESSEIPNVDAAVAAGAELRRRKEQEKSQSSRPVAATTKSYQFIGHTEASQQNPARVQAMSSDKERLTAILAARQAQIEDYEVRRDYRVQREKMFAEDVGEGYDEVLAEEGRPAEVEAHERQDSGRCPYDAYVTSYADQPDQTHSDRDYGSEPAMSNTTVSLNNSSVDDDASCVMSRPTHQRSGSATKPRSLWDTIFSCV